MAASVRFEIRRATLLLAVALLVAGAAAAEPQSEEEQEAYALKYGGLLRCSVCGDMVEKAARLHHVTPLGQQAGSLYLRDPEKKAKATLHARSTEIVDRVCPALIADAAAAADSSKKATAQLYCSRILESIDTKLVRFVTALSGTPQRTIDNPVSVTKGSKPGAADEVRFATEDEADGICKAFCKQKRDMRQSITDMQDQMRQQREALAAAQLAPAAILTAAVGLLWENALVAVLAIFGLTALGVFVQVRRAPLRTPQRR